MSWEPSWIEDEIIYLRHLLAEYELSYRLGYPMCSDQEYDRVDAMQKWLSDIYRQFSYPEQD